MLLVVTVLATFSLGVSAMEPAEGKIYEGIDVSAWQGDIDFAAVKAAGKEVVYIRASVGSNYIDPYFERNYNGAVANGLSVGFYHYMTATSISEAQEEARFFASVISGKAANCRPAMDYESFDGLSSGAVTSISLAFLETLEDATGQEVCLYSDAYNASEYLVLPWQNIRSGSQNMASVPLPTMENGNAGRDFNIAILAE